MSGGGCRKGIFCVYGDYDIMTTKRRQLRERISKTMDAHGWQEVSCDKILIDAIADASIDILKSRKPRRKPTRERKKQHTRSYTVKELCDMPYSDYLQTAHWQSKKQGTLARSNYHCYECLSTTSLQVHHLSYKRLGAEKSRDLRVLCDSCHRKAHGKD